MLSLFPSSILTPNYFYSLPFAAMTHSCSGQQPNPPFTQSFIPQTYTRAYFKVNSAPCLSQDFVLSSPSLTWSHPAQFIPQCPSELYSQFSAQTIQALQTFSLIYSHIILTTSFLLPFLGFSQLLLLMHLILFLSRVNMTKSS